MYFGLDAILSRMLINVSPPMPAFFRLLAPALVQRAEQYVVEGKRDFVAPLCAARTAQRAIPTNAYSPRFRSSNAFSLAGERIVMVLPLTVRSFCSRNFASVRENVSLTVPSSAASVRLVAVNSMRTG